MKKSEDKHIRYIDSTTHRVYKMVGRPFVLHNGSQKLRIKVNLVDSDSKNNGLASIKIKNGRGRITIPVAEGMLSGRTERPIEIYCCPLKVSEQRDIHPQCCCNGIADDFSEGKPLS